MIPKECKRLAEVDFPIAEVSKHSAREKSIRHGHPSTLHLWWARRPLAACRAMLMALLLPDPCDEHCPVEFKERARDILLGFHGRPSGWDKQIQTDKGLREIILKFIADFANWDNSSNPDYLAVGRGLVHAAHPDEPPLVVDPFAGGGSIPLEALRLGCEAFASDLNPVACLILKVMLEDIPRYGTQKAKVKKKNGEEIDVDGLAEALRIVGKEIKTEAEKELAEFYPKDPDGATPIACLWARTVRCEAPNCGAEIPLMRSFWLCKKASRKRALRWEIKRGKEKGKSPGVVFEIFEPDADKEVPSGTVTRAKATCLCCGRVLPPERVRSQLAEQRGGADVIFDKKGQRIGGARLLVVVTLNSNVHGRDYRLPTKLDYMAVWLAQEGLAKKETSSQTDSLAVFPNEGTPCQGGHRSVVSLRAYGMDEWGDLFTSRQKVGIAAITQLIRQLTILPPAAREVMGLALSRFTDICNACCMWESSKTQVRHLFTRHDLPVMWDFAEPSMLAEQAGDFSTTLSTMVRVIERFHFVNVVGQVDRADARKCSLPADCANIWFTDPPYYDAVAYADLSDFFYVWLKRVLPGHPLLTAGPESRNGLCPKASELTVTTRDTSSSDPKSRVDFERGMAEVFAEGHRVVKEDGVGSVVFAHKTTQGWEALLTGMIQGGWTITGSWPISTELTTRLNARDTASLGTSVHLVCRPRPEDAPVGDWGDVLRELPSRVGDWMERLQSEGVRGADLVFACIGPALEIYSRYSKVVDAEEREIPLGGDPLAVDPHRRGYLAYVWEAVGRAALEQVLGTAEALEEDARLTALFLWTLQSTNGEGKKQKEKRKSEESKEDEQIEDDEDERESRGKAKGHTLIFDVVRRFAQPLGIALPKWEGRIIEIKKGVVRLLPVSERAKVLFGKDGAKAVAYQLESTPPARYTASTVPRCQGARGGGSCSWGKTGAKHGSGSGTHY